MALKAGHAVLAGALLAAVFWALNRSADHESLGDAAATGNPAALPRATANDAILYKWKDESGVWNYTDQPPVDRPFERITGTPNVNTVPTVVPDLGLAEPSAPPAQ
jgi:hypothetical protein